MNSSREYPKITVIKKGAKWISDGHPWVYEGEVLAVAPEVPGDGGLCDVVSEGGKYLGTGFYNSKSKIRVRIISKNANDRFDAICRALDCEVGDIIEYRKDEKDE